nr:hypothetical protein Iba_chr13fCG1700 [Ipomoea batatas]
MAAAKTDAAFVSSRSVLMILLLSPNVNTNITCSVYLSGLREAKIALFVQGKFSWKMLPAKSCWLQWRMKGMQGQGAVCNLPRKFRKATIWMRMILILKRGFCGNLQLLPAELDLLTEG